MKSKLTSAEASILTGELIGREVEIANSSDPKLIGKKGKIINETMKMLEIKTSRGEIKVTKANNEFTFDGVNIKGKRLEFRPQERLKKYWRKVKK